MTDKSTRTITWGLALVFALPPLVFAGIIVAFMIGLSRENPDELPSALVLQPAPQIALEALPGYDGPETVDLTGPGIKLVNFWASWCGPCRVEHPTLVGLADSGVPIIGVNFKDAPDNAIGFLEELGNPYVAIGVDSTGRTGLDWGTYGIPETFVIDGDGKVLMRHPGPLTQRVYESRIAPLLEGQGN